MSLNEGVGDFILGFRTLHLSFLSITSADTIYDV
jgi:hypothetical protein